MLKRWMTAAAVVAMTGLSAVAQTAQQTDAVEDKMLPAQGLVLPWLVAFGILVMLLIAGFKSPGRSHLD